VAIRVLDEDGNIPYQACDGFSGKFVEMESPLSIHSDRCICINVIKGTTNPLLPFYTKGGSFYMNGTSHFLATVSEEEKGKTRNVCNAEGYESVALVPYRSGSHILGLIHVADHRENMVPLRIVEQLEGVAMQLGTAFQRARAENALRKSEAQYRSLFAHMVEGYAHCRMLYDGGRPTDFVYLDVNRAFETLTGLKDVVGRRVSDVIPGLRESDPGLFEIYGRVALTGKAERFELYVEALSNWFSISVYSPQEEHFVAVFDVITERKKAEESLRESEARFSKVFHSSPVGIGISRLSDNMFVDVNETFLKIYGFAREEIIGRSSIDLQLWGDPEERAAMIATLRRHGRVQNIEANFRRKSGETGVLLISAEVIEVAGRQCLLGMFSDITERKRMEEALVVSEAKYRDLVDNAPIGIYKASLDGRFLYVNKALATLFEFSSPEEMMSEGVLQRYKNPKDRESFIDSIQKNGKVHNFEIQTLSKSGKEIYLLLNSTLEGDVVSGMVLDMTEQKKLEAQLRHSQKMEAIGTLTGGIAHDFNNILNAVLGFGSLAIDKLEKGHPSRGDLKEVLAAAERAANLTQRLLAFSRKQIPDLKPVDINTIVIGIEKMLSRIIGEDIKLITDLTEQKAVVMADEGQLEQVLMNLAANARDAMPKGGRLTIHTGIREIDDEYIAAYGYGSPGQYAFISVTDTGSGIDIETQKKIFEPFFTTKGVGEGTGLGLSTAYGIVKQHKGFINVYSDAGSGTAFNILLPLTENLMAEKQDGGVVRPKGGKESILVVEDDVSLRKLSRIVLESFGYNVTTAENGEDAISTFIENKDRIRLVILDMIMPKKNGKEAAEEIRKIRPDIKIIFASGYTRDNIREKELLDKGMDFILKPVAPKDLLNKVREVLDR
jgi:PAS domain S-box-containing protein